MEKIKQNYSFLSCLLIVSIVLSASCSTFMSSKKVGKDKKKETKKDRSKSPVVKAKKLPKKDVKESKTGKKDTFLALSLRIEERVDAALKSKDGKRMAKLADELFFKASDASIRGDAILSSAIYKQVLRLKDDSDYLKKRYAVELVKTGDLVEAEKIFKGLFAKEEIRKKEANIGLILGGIYTTIVKPVEAKRVYGEVLKYHKDNEEACVFLAKAHAMSDEFKKAYKVLDTCEKNNKEAGIFSYYKGKMALEKGRRDIAIKHFRRSLKTEPTFYQSAIALGLIQEERKDFGGAIKIYRNYLKRDEMNYSVLQRLVNLFFLQNQTGEIVPYLEKLSSIDPENLNIKAKLGIIYSDRNELEKSKEVFQEILRQVPDSDKIRYFLGTLHQKSSEFALAVEVLSEVRPVSPLFSDSNIRIGQILQTLALKEFRAKEKSVNISRFKNFVEEKSKKYQDLRVDLGVVLAGYYEGTHNYLEAINALSSIQNEQKFSEDHEYYLVSLYEKNSNTNKAFKLVRKILKKNPDHADALNFLGYGLLESGGNLDEAYKHILRAVKLRPDDGYIRDSLGWYYFKIGKYAKALEELKKAMGMVKNDSTIIKHLAIIYQKMKNYPQAEKYYVEALKYTRRKSEKEDILRNLNQLKQFRLPASSQNK